MWFDVFALVGGGLAVWLGAEGMVRGAVKLAAYLGVSSMVIGLTVVAIGTSAPELVVSSIASAQGHGQIALGNVLGSNIINIGLVLGLSALLTPIAVESVLLKKDLAVLLLVTVALLVMSWIGDTVSRMDGLILVTGFVIFIIVSYRLAAREQARTTSLPGWERPTLKRRYIAFLVGGTIVLAVGAEGMVRGAVGVAEVLGVDQRIIAITIVAFGTSVPELAASLVAAKQGEGGLALGNVLGSNLFNILLILGTATLIRPIPVTLNWASYDFMFVLAFVVILFPLIRMGWRLGRMDGLILLFTYASFCVLLLA